MEENIRQAKKQRTKPISTRPACGECREKYCVIRESAQVPYFYTNRLGYRIIDIIVYVPLASYIQVEPYMNDIRAAMKELPFLRKTGTETPIITDDEAKAYRPLLNIRLLRNWRDKRWQMYWNLLLRTLRGLIL